MSSKEVSIIGVLASGNGSNFRAIYNAIEDGKLKNAEIGVLLSDNSNAGALAFAAEQEIPSHYLGDVSSAERNEAIAKYLAQYNVDIVILAGYLKLIGGAVLEANPDSILNIHPGPLPEFGGPGMYGHHVHDAIIASGAKWSGPTVHLVNAEYDKGQILAHRQVPVLSGDTAEVLAKRVLAAEHDLFWRVIADTIERGAHPELA